MNPTQEKVSVAIATNIGKLPIVLPDRWQYPHFRRAEMKRLYLITGGLGHLGSTIVSRLISRGESVRALILPTDKGERNQNAEYAEGNVTDKNSLKHFFENNGEELYLIHTAGIISIQDKGTEELWNVNVRGTENIIRCAMEYGVKRMVYVSSVHAIPERDDVAVLKEPDDYNPDSVKGEYAKSKAAASHLILEAARKGLNDSIVLPSGIIGPGDNGRNHLVQLCQMFLKNKLPMGVNGGYDMVDVRDAAEGTIRALENGQKGESYILSGSSVTIRELLRYMAKASGKKEKKCVPIWIARAAAPFFELDAKRRKKRPLFTRYSLMTLEENTRFSHDKASVYLGYSPRDISESVADMVHYLQKKEKECTKPAVSAMHQGIIC